jgi:SAM-dependent methyltransferase
VSAASQATGGYDPSFFDPIAAAERDHFWFQGRTAVISALAARALGNSPSACALEVGCGTGLVLEALQRQVPTGFVVGMDLHLTGLGQARRGWPGPLVCADVTRPPFARPFDLVGAFDVIEHLTDDEGALRHLYSLVRPGGALLVTVPAHPSLWSYFDEAAHHVRRYRRRDLVEKVTASGFRVEFSSEFMASLLPMVWLRRRLWGRRGGSSLPVHDLAEAELKVPPLVNRPLRWVLRTEAKVVGRARRLPFGTSVVVLARRP